MTTDSGETVTVTNFFDSDYDYALEELTFADGTVLDFAGIRDKAVADMKV